MKIAFVFLAVILLIAGFALFSPSARQGVLKLAPGMSYEEALGNFPSRFRSNVKRQTYGKWQKVYLSNDGVLSRAGVIPFESVVLLFDESDRLVDAQYIPESGVPIYSLLESERSRADRVGCKPDCFSINPRAQVLSDENEK